MSPILSPLFFEALFCLWVPLWIYIRLYHFGRGGYLSNSEGSSPQHIALVCVHKPYWVHVSIHAFHLFGYICSHAFCSFDVIVKWISACWLLAWGTRLILGWWLLVLQIKLTRPSSARFLSVLTPLPAPRIFGTSVCVGPNPLQIACVLLSCVGACSARTRQVTFPISSLVFGGASLLF